MTTPAASHATLGGIVMFASAAASMVWANASPETYASAFGAARPFINDGLMALFFFVVGMEIKRELVSGALSTPARALLPAAAALGGMAAPALVFLWFARGTPFTSGWGVPMATDIAFSVGVLALLGNRVPRTLVVFITALAVFDDVGGILVIALFYGQGVDARWLVLAGLLAWVVWLLRNVARLSGVLYAGVGVLLWLALHRSGVHATLSGVALGLIIPAQTRLERFVGLWRPWVTWVVLPLFALANAGVPLSGFSAGALTSPVTLGVGLGLLLGKPIGIFGVTVLAVRLKLAPMPEGVTSRTLFGGAVVAGIGFTVALFIAGLAFGSGVELEHAKVGVLLGSVAAGAGGALWLRASSRQ